MPRQAQRVRLEREAAAEAPGARTPRAVDSSRGPEEASPDEVRIPRFLRLTRPDLGLAVDEVAGTRTDGPESLEPGSAAGGDAVDGPAELAEADSAVPDAPLDFGRPPEPLPPPPPARPEGRTERSPIPPAPAARDAFEDPSMVASAPDAGNVEEARAGAASAPDGEAADETAPASDPAAEGGGQSVREPLMPPPPTGLREGERNRLAAVDARAGRAVGATTDLPAPAAQVGEARGAVEEPAEETRARAQDRLVEALGERPEPSPEIDDLCDRIRRIIREKRPPDEESLVDARPREMAQEAGTDLNDSVEGDAERVQGEYDDLRSEPEGTRATEATAMAPSPGPAQAPRVAGEQATPDGVAPEAVSLDADVDASEQRIEEAGMTTEPASMVESGPLADARQAQGELVETAERDPQEVLAEQEAVLAGANADMAELTASALGALRRDRRRTTLAGRGQQEGMVGSEESMRVQAAAEARAIFTDAQSRVTRLLEPLPRTAMNRWEAGVDVLSTRFEQHLARVQGWIDERHESTVLSVVDYFTGLPDWVTREYDQAERAFGEGVCGLIREISTEVNGVILACEAIIDDARTRIGEVFDALPEELRGWADEQQAEFGERLDGLQADAERTRSDFTRDLTERASEAVQSVREQVHELREAARGLLGRIADAIDAFLEDPARFILEGLLELVGIAPAAFWAVVDRIGQAIEDIADDPLGFAGNLLSALGQGFQQFFDNVGDHLLQGLLDWLFSGLGSVGVQLPSDTSLSSVITFFLQLMGLSWANIREILVRHVGEENVALVERAWELISALIEMGPEGLFELVKEQLDPANLLNIVLEAAVDFLIEALISAVTPRIIALFNPVGAIVQAIEAIYRVLRWIFENAARIFSLVETVVNGVTDLIAGNLGGMANAVEGALARLISPVIDFLAGYLGLGDLPDRIADVIRGMQARVLAVVDRVIGFLADRARALLRRMGLGEEEEEEIGPEQGEEPDAGADVIPEGLPPAEVKRHILEMVDGRLTGTEYGSTRAVRSMLQGVLGANASRGLHRLAARVEDRTTMGVLIEAWASEPEGRRIAWSEIFSPSELDTNEEIDTMRQRLSRASRASYAGVAVDGRAVGSLSRSGGGDHAEEGLVKGPYWVAAIQAAREGVEANGSSRITLMINRTPCSSCVAWLTSAIHDAKADLGPLAADATFVLAATGTYRRQGRMTKDDKKQLKEGSEALALKLGRPFDEVYEEQKEIWLEDLRSFSTEWVDPDEDQGEENEVRVSGLRELAMVGWEIAGLDAGQPLTARQRELARIAAELAEEFNWSS